MPRARCLAPVLPALLLFAFWSPAPAQGQSVTGTVQESGTGAPVAGAVVRLLDAGGQAVHSFLTAADGGYRLRAAAAGPHTLLVERIGYESTRVGPVSLVAGETTRRNVVVTHRPIELEGLRVEGSGRRCDLRDEGTGLTQVVWAQVRQALEAATWTGREGNLAFRIRGWERRLSPGSLTILDDAHRTALTRAGNSVRSLPAEELSRAGYVRTTESGMVDYFAPDAEALLSDTFLAEHCFSVRVGEGDEEGWLGLEFEPVLDRETADVRGVMWIERRSARLQRVDFDFVGLSYEVGEELAGGRIHYAQLPDGRWVVEDWRIRAPALVVVRSNSALGRRDRLMVEAVYETGAEILSVRGTDFEWAPDRAMATLRGTVFDSVTGAPLSGATVRVAGRGWSAETDARGRFELNGLPPGRYRVLFEHERLDSLGLAPRGRDVSLEAGAEEGVELALPSRATVLAETCPADLDGGTAVGWVTTPDGTTPVPGATVRAAEPGGEALAQVRAGLDGSYRMCGLPSDRPLVLSARMGPVESSRVEVRTDSTTHARANLTLGWSAAAAPEAAPGLVVSGTVRDRSNDRPLASATVEVVDLAGVVLERVLTDAQGAFRVSVDADEATKVRFASLGYASLESGTLPEGRRRHRVEAELSPEAMEVEGVVVEVEGRRPALEGVGFYDRMARINADFLDREELGLESARRVSDALQRVGGIQRLDLSSFTGNTTRQYIQFRSATRVARLEGGACMPAVYVDGSLVRWGKNLGPGDSDYPTLDELVSGADIEAMELYDSSSSLPPRFMGPGTLCGAIVVWTLR